jgi:hypothetical protein
VRFVARGDLVSTLILITSGQDEKAVFEGLRLGRKPGQPRTAENIRKLAIQIWLAIWFSYTHVLLN